MSQEQQLPVIREVKGEDARLTVDQIIEKYHRKSLEPDQEFRHAGVGIGDQLSLWDRS